MDLEQLQEWGHFIVPPHAYNVQYEITQGIDNLALISFQMNSTDVETFIAELGFTKPLRPNYRPFPRQDADVPVWWQPDQAQNFVGGSVLLSGLSREVLIDLKNPASPTIFLRTYEVG